MPLSPANGSGGSGCVNQVIGRIWNGEGPMMANQMQVSGQALSGARQIAFCELTGRSFTLITGVVASSFPEPERQLYRLLREEGGDAYSRYNALIRELVSFEQALDRRQSRKLCA